MSDVCIFLYFILLLKREPNNNCEGGGKFESKVNKLSVRTWVREKGEGEVPSFIAQ